MTENHSEIENYKIWYPYEVFYIESMLSVARTAMTEQTILRKTLEEHENGKPIGRDDADFIIDLVQNIINRAAIFSRYFWPSENNNKRKDLIHQKRGERLREAFEINDPNPLKDKLGRNFIEHFDEKLDIYLSKGKVGTFIPSYVGPRANNDQGVYHFFRAFYVTDWTFVILNEEYEIHSIVCEIIRIYLLLEKFSVEGGRLPTRIDT